VNAFTALRSGPVTLYLIDTWNIRNAADMVCRFSDKRRFREELLRSYVPASNAKGIRTKWGFYARLDGEIAGLSLLGISEKSATVGYTGADTLTHMRGKGVAPGSKPCLFYLGFELLNLKRIETGCHVSNEASKRSIEKTPDFEFVGVSPSPHSNEKGEVEDENRYAIKRADWKKLYADIEVEVLV
jgi:ribosomal-protein-serine acetyltransferase